MEYLAETKPPGMPMEGDRTGVAPQQYKRPKLSWKTAMVFMAWQTEGASTSTSSAKEGPRKTVTCY